FSHLLVVAQPRRIESLAARPRDDHTEQKQVQASAMPVHGTGECSVLQRSLPDRTRGGAVPLRARGVHAGSAVAGAPACARSGGWGLRAWRPVSSTALAGNAVEPLLKRRIACR